MLDGELVTGAGTPDDFEGVLAAEKAIEAAAGEFSACEYPGTDHARFNDTRPVVYAPEAAALAWERTLAYLNDRIG